MYINLKEVTQKAKELNYTVGAFNTHNLEMLPEMIRAAKEKGAPIIIQTSVSTAKYIGYKVLVEVCKLFVLLLSNLYTFFPPFINIFL